MILYLHFFMIQLAIALKTRLCVYMYLPYVCVYNYICTHSDFHETVLSTVIIEGKRNNNITNSSFGEK